MNFKRIFNQISLPLRKLTASFRKQSTQKTSDIVRLEALIGSELGDSELYRQAFTHRSYEGMGANGSNERLEFLGDSVISLVVSRTLYELYPDESEGTLTNIRSFLISRKNMNATAEKMGLNQWILADSSVQLIGNDIMGNTLEALVGALFLDKGFAYATNFVRSYLIVSKNNVKTVAKKEEDYKTELIILLQKNKIPYEFVLLDTKHSKELGFVHRTELRIHFPDKEVTTIGVGPSKKISHQNASKEALRRISKLKG